jgi:predicted metal-dependent hydrolase
MVQPGRRQLELDLTPGEKSAAGDTLDAHRRRISGYLTMRLPEPVDLVFTDNRSTMISFRKQKGRLSIRLHHMFRHADQTVLELLARYLSKRDLLSSKALEQFIASHQTEIRRGPSGRRLRRSPRSPQGNHHDLSVVLDRVSKTYFAGKVDVRIEWARAPARRRVRHRRRKTISRALATYCFDDKTIRVSPILDAPFVPDYMLEWVIYHEVLHHVLPVEEHRGRRRYHTTQFRALERGFNHYEKAQAWETAHLDELLK